MKVKEEREKAGLKLNIQKMKIMPSGPITSWQIDGGKVTDFIFLGCKIIVDGDWSHKIKGALLLGRKSMTTGKTTASTMWTLVGKVMSLPFNTLSRFVIAFPASTKRLLISWLQSPSAVFLEPKKIKFVTVSIFKNTGVDCNFLLQGIISAQASNPRLQHCRQILYCWATREAPLRFGPHLILCEKQRWECRWGQGSGTRCLSVLSY